ncbi:MAG: hypothetical protein EPN84_12010 [Legionella sp.]|nr:MAG: hypothetical protein EPN84_12010 [Legionella sp.]
MFRFIFFFSWYRSYLSFPVSYLILASLLCACSSSTAPMLSAAKSVIHPKSGVSLDPDYRYLRTSFISHSILPSPVAYLALGSSQYTSSGLLQIWYSADKEIIKLCNARLCGTAGLPVDWRKVLLKNIPSWDQIRLNDIVYERQRFVMPGFHFGIQDQVFVHKIAAPKRSLLVGFNPNQLIWFKENTICSQKNMRLPDARYAVDFSGNKPQVIYSEQCLAKGLCFAFQIWTADQEKTFSMNKKHRL